MRKILSIVLTGAMVLSLAACGSKADNKTTDTDAGSSVTSVSENETSETEVPETITLTNRNGAGETVEVEFPYNPKRLADIPKP